MTAWRHATRRAWATGAAILGLTVAPPSHAQDGDVVVVAPQLRTWRAALVVGANDIVRCRVIKTSGDAALDTLGCEGMMRCFEVARPQLTGAGTIRQAAARKRRLAEINRALEGCVRAVSTRVDIYPITN